MKFHSNIQQEETIMKLQEFRELRLNDAVIDENGNVTKAYDIDRNKRAVKTCKYGGRWRHFTEVTLPDGQKTA